MTHRFFKPCSAKAPSASEIDGPVPYWKAKETFIRVPIFSATPRAKAFVCVRSGISELCERASIARYFAALDLERRGTIPKRSSGFQKKGGFPSVWGSPRNSSRYLPTAAGDADAGVPSWISRRPSKDAVIAAILENLFLLKWLYYARAL